MITHQYIGPKQGCLEFGMVGSVNVPENFTGRVAFIAAESSEEVWVRLRHVKQLTPQQSKVIVQRFPELDKPQETNPPS